MKWSKEFIKNGQAFPEKIGHRYSQQNPEKSKWVLKKICKEVNEHYTKWQGSFRSIFFQEISNAGNDYNEIFDKVPNNYCRHA